MKINKKISIISVFGLLSLVSFTVHSQPDPVSIRTILDTTSGWDQNALPADSRVNIKEFIIQPGEKTVIHKHAVNGGGYILEGELTMYVTQEVNGSFNDQSKVQNITLKEGDTWAETINTWHYGINYSQKPVKFIVTFIGDKDTPQTTAL